VDSPGVLSAVEREMRRRGLVSALMPWLENAAGILAAPAIALSSPTVSALLFGAYDFAADVGADVAWDPLRFARSQVVLAAAAAGIVALDGPLADFRDDRRLRRDCILGRRMGFTGKVAIHPAQVDIVTPHFTPSAEEIARSRRVVETITDAERGAVRLDQTMIDRATYRIALRHLALSERLAESGES
jgi:(S)-citramalyl-CoA lyase